LRQWLSCAVCVTGCEGVQNIMDDIIVHGENAEEHEKHLENVVRVLTDEKG